MVAPQKPGHSGSSGTGRRSTRLAIAIPITISGKDSTDRAFKEDTRTIIINKHGAKIATVHQLGLGAEVLLENRALGRSVKTAVVWLGDRHTAKDPQEVGLQLYEPENIWGIDFAPDDWQEGPPIGEGGQRLEKIPALAAPPAAAAIPGPAEKETAASGAALAPPAAPTTPVITAAEVEARFEERFRQFERELNHHVEQLFTKYQARLDELTAAYLATLAPKFEAQQKLADEQIRRLSASALEELHRQSDALVAGIQTQLHATVHEIQQKGLQQVVAQLQKSAGDYLSLAAKNLQGQAAESLQALTAELKTTGQNLVGETQKELEKARLQALDTLIQEGKNIANDHSAQVRKTLQDFQDQRTHELADHLQKALEKQRQAVLKQVQLVGDDVATKAVAQVKNKCEEVARIMLSDLDKRAATLKDSEEGARGRLEAYSQLLEGSARASVEAFQEQAATFNSTLEQLRGESGDLVGHLQSRMQEAARAIEDESTKRIEERIREASLKQMEEVDKEFDQKAQETLEMVAEQLREKQEEIVGEASELLRTTLGQMFLGQSAAAKKPSEGESLPAKKRR